MATQPRYLTGDSEGIKNFIDSYDVFIFDCDGVLWSGDTVFEGSAQTLELLRSHRKRIIFVTNNSTKSRADYAAKLSGLGIPATADEVFGSAYSAAVYVARILRLPAATPKVFVLGEAGVEAELAAEGVPVVGGTDPALRREIAAADYPALASGAALDPGVGCVLAGLDRHVNYLKLAHAFAYLQRGAAFLATNVDSTLPSAGALFPGAGSVAAPLERMLGRAPTALGKPGTPMMDAIEGRFQFDRTRACMVGDRLNTDIRFGIEGGLGGTLAVLTGVSKKEEWEAEGAEIRPMYYADRLADLLG